MGVFVVVFWLQSGWIPFGVGLVEAEMNSYGYLWGGTLLEEELRWLVSKIWDES